VGTDHREVGWAFHNPVRVQCGQLPKLLTLLSANARVLLVTSAGFERRGLVATLRELLGDRLCAVIADVKPNPDMRDVDATIATLQGQEIDTVLALGGGSVIDAAKACALGLTAPGLPSFAEGLLSAGPSPWTSRLRLVVIPTTAGTGSEVTPFATLWDHQLGNKHSVSGPAVFPDVALLVPELTVSLPRDHTLYPALDAVSHALESLWNHSASPMSRSLAIGALSLSVEALPALLAGAGTLAMREKMQAASLMAGMAISQTRTAIAHSMSYPLTARLGIPHGLACSFTLPVLLRVNLQRMAETVHDAGLLGEVLTLLEELRLGEEVQRFAPAAEVLSLAAEMTLSDRAANYAGVALGDLSRVLEVSLNSDSVAS